MLDGLDLRVDAGEFVALVGASGVGKSSLLRAVDGLLPLDAGQIERAGDARSGSERPRAMVFQDPRLLPWRTVAGNVAYGLESTDLTADARDVRVADVLELVGLHHLADRWPGQLSGGQQQRVGLARALAVRPRLLLMDEPFSAVDAITRRELQRELVRLWQLTNCAVVFVTHDVAEAVYLADRVLLLAGTPARVRASFDVDLGRPRAREDARLFELAAAVTSALERA